jgi:hypothetical protein
MNRPITYVVTYTQDSGPALQKFRGRDLQEDAGEKFWSQFNIKQN